MVGFRCGDPRGSGGGVPSILGPPQMREEFRAVVEKMIDLLRELQAYHRELFIASQLYWRPGKKLVPVAERALREAAGAGYPDAMCALGSRLLDGRGLTVDPAEGERWLRRAADAGDPDAMRALGSRLLDGRGLTVDPAEGERWLRRAADAGDPHAMGELGSRLLDGRGLTVDPAEGERWLRRAADAGDPDAMRALSSASWTGVG